jgi:hypothetical protein
MSKNKTLKRARRILAPALVTPAPVVEVQPVASEQASPAPMPVRVGFSLQIVFDPKKPEHVQYSLLPNGEGMPRDGDILSALQLTRDDILIKSAAELARQQMQMQIAPVMPTADAAAVENVNP